MDKKVGYIVTVLYHYRNNSTGLVTNIDLVRWRVTEVTLFSFQLLFIKIKNPTSFLTS